MKKIHTRGMTLIEILIYLALYTILVGGSILSAYTLISTSSRNQAKAMAQEEGNYLIGKIDWMLTGAKSINEPNDHLVATIDRGTTLSVTKYDTSVGDPLVASVSDGVLSFGRSGHVPVRIHNTNTTVTCPAGGCFTHVSTSGDGINPESLTATFTIHTVTSDGREYAQEFTTVKYLRK